MDFIIFIIKWPISQKKIIPIYLYFFLFLELYLFLEQEKNNNRNTKKKQINLFQIMKDNFEFIHLYTFNAFNTNRSVRPFSSLLLVKQKCMGVIQGVTKHQTNRKFHGTIWLKCKRDYNFTPTLIQSSVTICCYVPYKIKSWLSVQMKSHIWCIAMQWCNLLRFSAM